MSPRKIILLLATVLALPLLMPSSSSAQGILRRLRDRMTAPPVPVPTRPGLPARPAPTTAPAQTRQAPRTAPRTSTRPSARYQVPNRQPSGAGSAASRSATSPSAGRTIATPGYGRSTGVTQIPSTSRGSIATPIPSMPTPAIGSSGVNQASATRPVSPTGQRPTGQRPSASSGQPYGKSILKPLSFDDKLPTSNVGQQVQDPSSGVQGANAITTIGIQAVAANPGYPGIQVRAFRSHSLADEAGLEVGDYIFGLDNVPTPSVAALSQEVRRRRPGQMVQLRIGRDGKVSDLEVQLVARPGSGSSRTNAQETVASSGPKIGAEVRDVEGTRGVVVTRVQPGSIAQSGGIRVQDRIIAINGRMVANTSDLLNQLSTLQEDRPFEMRVVRDSQLVNAIVPLGEPVVNELPTNRVASETPEPNETPAPSGGGSLLGGLGSVLGGVFGTGTKPTPAANASKELPKPAGGDTPLKEETRPIVEGIAAPVQELLPPTQATMVDPLSLEPVFEEMPTLAPESDSKEELKSEIERLKERLKALEAKAGEAKAGEAKAGEAKAGE